MWKHFLISILLAPAVSGSFIAQPVFLDDLKFLEPNMEASVVGSFQFESICGTASTGSFLCEAGQGDGHGGSGVDAMGHVYQLTRRVVSAGAEAFCPSYGDIYYEIERIDEGSRVVIARLPQCVMRDFDNDGVATRHLSEIWNFKIDSTNGVIILAFRSADLDLSTNHMGVVLISGVPALLDIILTFQPATGTLSWVTSKHPKALLTADRFMVFAGDLRDIHDLRRAAAIDCDVTAGTPLQPGDSLSILDPLPTPPVGQGSFVVIGMENAGQRQFGRQMMGHELSGRDPVAFTGCG